MIEVKDGTIHDESGKTLNDMMVCEHCIYCTELTKGDESGLLLCSKLSALPITEVHEEYRCDIGKWLCRQYGKEVSPVAVLTMDEIIQHRLGNEETLEIFSPWF